MQTMMSKKQLAERVKTGRHVVVLRGVSGAGKTTLAKFLYAHTDTITVHSADNTFMGPDNVYRFDPSRLREAHADCLRSFVYDLQTDSKNGIENSLLIVDNTNTTVAEAAPYMALAAAYDFKALLVTLQPISLIEAAARNVHGLMVGTVIAQADRLSVESDRLPPFWECATLVEERPGVEYVREVPVVLGESLDPSELSNRGLR